jgi:hypothetical protein
MMKNNIFPPLHEEDSPDIESNPVTGSRNISPSRFSTQSTLIKPLLM